MAFGIPSSTRRLLYIRDLLYELVVRDIKLRYKRSLLGIGWSLLNPLTELLVYSFVFGRVIPQEIPNFVVFLFIGILSWNWFQAAIMAATNSIVGNRDLIKRPGFPSPVLPIISVASNFIHFIIALPILFVLMYIEGVPLTETALLIPLIIVLQFTFTLGVAYFVATFHVTFRDTEYLVGIFLRLLLFVSGIFFSVEGVREEIWLINANPILHIINAYRFGFMNTEIPLLGNAMMWTAIASIILLVFGYITFQRTSYRYIEEL